MNHRRWVLLFTGFLVLLQLVNIENVSAQTNSQEKPTVGIIDLELTGQIDTSARVPLSDELRKELFKTGKFNVLERNSMDRILKEQKFQRTDACSDTACIVEMGRVLGAQKMVAGSLGKVGNTYLLNVRLIDVATGSIEQIGDDKCKCELDELITSIETVAKKLAQLPVEERTRTSTGRGQDLPTGEEKQNTQEITKSIGMKFVLIKAGEFMMGSPDNEKGRDSDEGPQHKVTLTKDFYMQTTEVTQGQFAKFIKDSGYKTDAEKEGSAYIFDGKIWAKKEGADWRYPGYEQGDEHPIVCVSWNDAQAFCRWISEKESKEYRLPTEAEWEYACRAGTTTAYQWGDNPDDGAGWCNGGDKEYWSGGGKGNYFEWRDGYKYTSPAGIFKPNKFGLYDMHGNVWEWCNDWYGEYPSGSRTDPTGPGSGNSRVMRGGSWFYYPPYIRSAKRGSYGPDGSNDSLGFRCSRTP